ncbi:MAG TPA: hypothetical protein VHP31_11530 [Caproicibacter sp.]|nr:hypothetical protein [Caproicibacter sp.]
MDFKNEYPRLALICRILNAVLLFSTLYPALRYYSREICSLAFIILSLPNLLSIWKMGKRKEKLNKELVFNFVMCLLFFAGLVTFSAIDFFKK